MPTPRASDGPKGSPNQHGSSGDLMLPSAIHALLPTPSVAGGGKHIPEDAEWSGKAAYKPGGGKKVQVHIDQIHKLLPTPMANEGRKADTTQGAEDREGHQVYLTNVVCDLSAPTEARLLPTPTTKSCGYNSDGDWSLNAVDKLLPTPTRRDHKDHKVERAKHRPEAADNLSRALADRLNEEKWGEYAVAIALWESLHAPVPEPTEPGPSGPRLSPAFSEWMMGLPAGFITDPDIWVGWGRNKKGVDRSPRNAQLQAIGNGVVPQQAAAGIRVCLQIALMPVESAWEGKVQQKRWGSLLKREMRRK